MDLDNLSLLDLQTSYMSKDTSVIAMCKASESAFRKLAKESLLPFIYGRIDELEDDMLDELAWQFHVDFYSVDLPLNVKRSLIKNAKKIHKEKGTPAAVETLLSSLFGNAKLKEWFEYDGEPFMFKVAVEVENDINMLIDKFEESINTVKNTRSHLERIEIYSVSRSKLRNATCLVGGEEVTVYPWSPKELSSRGKVKLALGNNGGYETTVLYPKRKEV